MRTEAQASAKHESHVIGGNGERKNKCAHDVHLRETAIVLSIARVSTIHSIALYGECELMVI